MIAISTIKKFVGLSTDVKPTAVPAGSTFFETDTGALYITSNGTNWHFKDDPEPYLYRVSEGKIANKKTWYKIAFNPTLSDAAIIAPSDPATYPWPSAGIQPVVVSSSVEDDDDKGVSDPGTGIHEITVTYLDADHVEHTEDVVMNGTAEVTMTAEDVLRINDVQTKTVGTGGSAAGNISVLDGSGGDMIGYIAEGNNCNRVGVYTVPAGKTLYITNFMISGVHGAANKRAIIQVVYKPGNSFFTGFETALVQSAINVSLSMPLALAEKTDMAVKGESDGTATAHVFANGWLEG